MNFSFINMLLSVSVREDNSIHPYIVLKYIKSENLLILLRTNGGKHLLCHQLKRKNHKQEETETQIIMKNRKKGMHVALMCIFGVAASCEPNDKDVVCQTAKEFAETYYNLDIRKAQDYCTKELESVMNFKHSYISEKEKEIQKQIGSARIKIIGCELDEEKGEASVRIEVSNFLRRNYLTDSVSLIHCDTIDLTLVKQIDGVWRIKAPF